MRVFVTGATGWIGSAVVDELIGAGHEVTGLTRSESGARLLVAKGATALRGALDDTDILRTGAEQSDGAIHLAFTADFSRMAQNCADDKHAIDVIGEALEGSDRPFIVTSGVAMLAPGRIATEQDRHGPVLPSFPRASEQTAFALAGRGVKSSVVRLPPSVHGLGETHGFMPLFANLARQKGVSAYVADGANRWPAVHRLDAARVFRLALENGAQGGPFHAVADRDVPFSRIAEVIGRNLGLPVKALSTEEAAEHFGGLTRFAGGDWPASSQQTGSRLGWEPEHPDLLSDIAHPSYFAGV